MKKFYTKGELLPVSGLELKFPDSVKDGEKMLKMSLSHFGQSDDRNRALWISGSKVVGDLDFPPQSDSWLEDHDVGIVVFDGDLTIEGDLINGDSGKGKVFLVVTGTLTLRNWFRGGAISWIGGDVVASGCLVGEYNDSALFVGGDLCAKGGYIHRRKPYPDFSDIEPHQVGGKIMARSFDASRENISSDEFRETFVAEVLEDDEDGVWYDSAKLMEHCSQGLSIWRTQE